MSRTTTASLAAAAALALGTAVAPAANATTNDPYYPKLWGLQTVNAEQAWPTSTGAGVTVAVVDTGVDLTQPDLVGHLVPGATFAGCPTQGVSCGNGDWKGYDGVGQPDDVHGTHVSGIVAATANNGIGVAGVAPDAKIMPIKVLEGGSGNNVDIAAGIRYAADHGASVINLSLGSLPGGQVLGLLDTTATDAIKYARDKGVLTVAAAGNSSTALCNDPAFNSVAICVGAIGPRNLKAYYSEFPIKPDLNTVAAPGGSGLSDDENIWSSVPQGTGANGGDYASFAGTSMATPHVAGVAALLFAQGRGVDNVQKSLQDTAINPLTGIRGGYSLQYGRGVVDAAAAVQATR
ncbi:S8 family serine peptidase [Calidifontibacter sp. DB0510]|uniref:S8 family serine peptidase n=1 Tax=Metallococcus carri TaxID=1656884 RepID=A0A967EG51_9MICO|nr:S8 family serine peptidase [Metallococcus carri]NHN54633.1 S8 family serine peptidase [Metallococcus carri]NOP36528.1 S8 family serine peptidase [Calidifontibacter sp. DB2511S]